MQHQEIRHVYLLDDWKTSQRNGIGTFINQLITLLKTEAIQFHLVQFNSDVEEFRIFQELGIEYIKFPYLGEGGISSHADVIGRFLRLYIDDQSQPIFMVNHFPMDELMRMLKTHFKRCRLIYTVHDMAWNTQLKGDFNLFIQYFTHTKRDMTGDVVLELMQREKNMMRLADRVVCLSEDTKNILKQYHSVEEQKIHWIPNTLLIPPCKTTTLEKKQLKREYGIPEQERVLLFVGRTSKAKGFFELIKAFKRVCQKHEHVRLIVAGNPYTIDWTPYLSCITQVTVLGYVDKTVLYKLYRMADIGVVSSYSEQCSYVGLEMMAHRLPVVASNALGVRNMFKNEVNALTASVDFTEPENYSKNLADTIGRLLEDAAWMEKLQSGAEEVYRTTYDARIVKEKYLNLFKTM